MSFGVFVLLRELDHVISGRMLWLAHSMLASEGLLFLAVSH